MADKKPQKLKARLPRGLADRGPAEIAATRRMIEAIRAVYERYGFDPVETPAIEYTDALGKFLPDQDRPNEGVFSFHDDDEQWLSLRYDLTAPLARYVAENFQNLALPYRSYREGYVFRNEKPGPGRFRQFMQFDADTVGSASPAADAEMCMMAADAMEALGIKRGDYVVKVNSRRLLDGVMESIGLGGEENAGKRLTVLRALDKYDRLGIAGVRRLLGEGRTDESGDFTKGAGLPSAFISTVVAYVEGTSEKKIFEQLIPTLIAHSDELHRFISSRPPNKHGRESPNLTGGQIDSLLSFFSGPEKQVFKSIERYSVDDRIIGVGIGNEKLNLPITNQSIVERLQSSFNQTESYRRGVDELEKIAGFVSSAGYGTRRIQIDPSVVRGLEYYTGAVFEVELTFETKDEKGHPVRFGSVGGGGRYDGLVSRFRGEPVPATGFSVGVSRLLAALQAIKSPIVIGDANVGPVLVTVLDQDRIADYQNIVATLRSAGIRSELYLGNPKHSVGQQLRYADKRRSPCAIIQGSDEKAKNKVLVKDLILGATLAKNDGTFEDAKDRQEHLKNQKKAQKLVSARSLIRTIKQMLQPAPAQDATTSPKEKKQKKRISSPSTRKSARKTPVRKPKAQNRKRRKK